MARFVRIAEGYDTMALTLAVTGLEGAGITVLTPGRHLDSVLPNTAGVLGAVPILVPWNQAEAAMDWLRALAPEGIKVLDAPQALPGQGAGVVARPGWLARLAGRLLLGGKSEN